MAVQLWKIRKKKRRKKVYSYFSHMLTQNLYLSHRINKANDTYTSTHPPTHHLTSHTHPVSSPSGKLDLRLVPQVALVTSQGPQGLAETGGGAGGGWGSVDSECAHATAVHVIPEGHAAGADNDWGP